MPGTTHVPYALRRVWDPALDQGGRVRRRYFEGWYFKSVDAGEEHPAAAFSFADRPPFRIAVRANVFTADAVTLDLRNDRGAVRGLIAFGPWRGRPARPLAPGIMGWHRVVPRME